MSRLSPEQQDDLAAIVEKDPDRAVDGVVRWPRVDLKHIIKERFGVDCDTRNIGKPLHKLDFSRISARPRHPVRTPQYRRGVQEDWSRSPNPRGVSGRRSGFDFGHDVEKPTTGLLDQRDATRGSEAAAPRLAGLDGLLRRSLNVQPGPLLSGFPGETSANVFVPAQRVAPPRRLCCARSVAFVRDRVGDLAALA